MACKSKQKVCEHARDRISELSAIEGEAAIQDAPADQKQLARETADRITNTIRDNFVEVCVESNDEEIECLAKIDGFVDATLEARRGALECEAKTSDEDTLAQCGKWYEAVDAARESYGKTCYEVQSRLSMAAYDRKK